VNANAKPSPDVNSPKGVGEALDAIDPAKALAPATVRLNAQRVARGFWPKIRKVAAKIPFADDALSVWWCVRDPTTPAAAKGLMLAALAYFVLPTDVIPDMIVGLGFTDDAAVLAAVLAVVGKHVKPAHKAAARGFLDRMGADD
jgi:uncharacterized membrane protein YkvA (DUF1232 family)